MAASRGSCPACPPTEFAIPGLSGSSPACWSTMATTPAPAPACQTATQSSIQFHLRLQNSGKNFTKTIKKSKLCCLQPVRLWQSERGAALQPDRAGWTAGLGGGGEAGVLGPHPALHLRPEVGPQGAPGLAHDTSGKIQRIREGHC